LVPGSLPETISALTRLEVLTLRDNELGRDAPGFVLGLTNLKTLTLGKNKQKKLPDKELQGANAWDTEWMHTPRPITPRVDPKLFPDSRVYYPSSGDEEPVKSPSSRGMKSPGSKPAASSPLGVLGGASPPRRGRKKGKK
jgi:Leucine-rich repeat (LRR) protein